jgi:hypothetical protein
MNRTLFEKIKQAIEENRTTFDFKIKDTLYSFVVNEVCQAKYIYCAEYKEDGVHSVVLDLIGDCHKGLNLVAIAREDSIFATDFYIVDNKFFGLDDLANTGFPSDVSLISEITNQYNDLFYNEFMQHYKNVKISKDNSDDIGTVSEYLVRKLVLEDADVFGYYFKLCIEKIYNKGKLSKTDILSDICGYYPIKSRINDIIKNVIENEKDIIKFFRKKAKQTEECIKKGVFIEQWEADMFNSLKLAKNKVIVTFEFNNNITKTTIKDINYNIKHYIVNKEEDGWTYNIVDKRVLKKLGAKSFSHYSDNENVLTLKNIIKMEYNKHVIYEK